MDKFYQRCKENALMIVLFWITFTPLRPQDPSFLIQFFWADPMFLIAIRKALNFLQTEKLLFLFRYMLSKWISTNWLSFWLVQIFTVKYGPVSDPASSTMISRNVYLPFPVVTDRFILTVNNGSTPILFMMDVIGSDPAAKYSTDPMLSPAIYKDCKLFCDQFDQCFSTRSGTGTWSKKCWETLN